MAPTIYVITYYEFNHNTPPERDKPLDPRLLASDHHYVYYLIDQSVPAPLQGKPVLLEQQIDPVLYEAGGRHLGEWSFLLAEAQHAFCEYPLFMISSRFYQKNRFLQTDLNVEWERLFGYLAQYGWGYLPSYDRPLDWIGFDWQRMKRQASTVQFVPFTAQTFPLIEELYGVRIPADYPAMSDLACNYIGFQSREHLLAYVDFYRPLIHTFFDAQYRPIRDLAPYIRTMGVYPNEKPFTFYLEFMSHLFFYQRAQKVFALHYDGYYEVDERHQQFRRLAKIAVPWHQGLQWRLRWTQWRLWCWLIWHYANLPDPMKQRYRQAKSRLKRA